MDKELADRLQGMEERLSRIENQRGIMLEGGALKAKFDALVMGSSPQVLQAWFRQTSPRDRALALCDTPRNILLKAKEGLSANAWTDLVDSWKENRDVHRSEESIQEMLREFSILLKSGEVQALELGSYEVAPSGPPDSPAPALAAKGQHPAKAEGPHAASSTMAWLNRELPEGADAARKTGPI